MKISVVQIGNSRGVRIPKAVLEQCNIKDEVDLEVEHGKLILKPTLDKPRQGWEEQFAVMSDNEDDHLLIDDAVELDADDWQW